MEITEEQIREAAKKYANYNYYNLMAPSDDVIHIFKDAVTWTQEQQPKWISVKDRLPENSGWYLVANPNVQTSFFFIEPDHVGRTNQFIDEGVTHWMTLPEAPKGI